MGKYDDLFPDIYKEHKEATVDIALIVTWVKIANELAEANRLKRLELSETIGSVTQEDDEDSKSWKPDKELEDQA